MDQLDSASQNKLEINDILNTIDNLYKLEYGSEGMVDGFCLTEYELAEKGFMESQIQEIMLGNSQKLDISIYAKECYNWKQMRQIRLGLLDNLDTSVYENPLFSAEQMHEIRLGLISRIDVSSYAKLIFTARDMSVQRKKLLAQVYKINPNSFGKEITDSESGIYIKISDDCLKAYIKLPKEEKEYSPYELKKILMRHDIVYGIIMPQLKKLVSEKLYGQEILVAEGRPATKGKSGRYEYFFNKLLPESPKIHDNGTIDYTEVIVAEKVAAGTKLALYHPGTPGKPGQTVTGICLDGELGRDLPPFTGTGFVYDAEKNIYTSTVDGFVSLDETQYNLNVWNIFVVEGDVNRYNGHITYDGTIHIKGSVSDMAVITASGDVVVDGVVSSAEINAGGSVILKKGINADGKGFIQAGGSVMGNFFEYANIKARGRIEGNYFLNCNAETDNSLIAKGNKSRIMGGCIKAGKSVESVAIGNYGGSKTSIDVGNMVWIEARISKFHESLAKVNSEIYQLEQGKRKLQNLFGEEALKNNNLFQTACIAIKQRGEQKKALEREMHHLKNVRRDAKKAYIRAYGEIQEGVTVIINGNQKVFQHTVRGTLLRNTVTR